MSCVRLVRYGCTFKVKVSPPKDLKERGGEKAAGLRVLVSCRVWEGSLICSSWNSIRLVSLICSSWNSVRLVSLICSSWNSVRLVSLICSSWNSVRLVSLICSSWNSVRLVSLICSSWNSVWLVSLLCSSWNSVRLVSLICSSWNSVRLVSLICSSWNSVLLVSLCRFGVGGGGVELEEVVCEGVEAHLLRCRYSRTGGGSSCQHQYDVAVACCTLAMCPSVQHHNIHLLICLSVCLSSANVSTPYSGEVRLTGGNTPSVGVVELYTHRQWAPLCWAGFEQGQANAVCRQLGYTAATSFRCVVCAYVYLCI